MPTKNRELESALYPVVDRWMKRHFQCFKSAINLGLSHSRVDVLGVRDVGGDLSGQVESICIEVKRGSEPFATASGQALGYQVYANRVYLAAVKSDGFEQGELDIASHLGIGLVEIKGKQCREVLSSPFYTPIARMSLQLFERMGLCLCRFCGTYFETGSEGKSWHQVRSNITRENFRRAVDKNHGLVFWHRGLAERKHKTGVRVVEDGAPYDRRFICQECVQLLSTINGAGKV